MEEAPEGKKKGLSQKKSKKSNKNKASQRKNIQKPNAPQTGDDLSTKILATMEKHKEVFFVIRLHSAQSAASLGVSSSFHHPYSPRKKHMTSALHCSIRKKIVQSSLTTWHSHH
jgi:hypothetical protein